MSGRPGRMVDCIAVGLPRPRSLEATLSPAFVAAKRRLLEPLREAALEGVPGWG